MKEKKKSGALYNLLFNIVIPVLIMTKYSKPEYLGPMVGLCIALSFPLGFGLWEFITSKNVNFISIIGFISVMLTGVLGLFHFNPFWIAVKEASVPLLIGIAIIISEYTKYPLVRKMLYNDTLMDVEKIDLIIKEKQLESTFARLMKQSGFFISFSFFFSSVLNYTLAVIIVKSDPGTVQYTQEIGKMTALSFPVIAVPSMILMMIIMMYLVKKLKKLTNLEFEEIFNVK